MVGQVGDRGEILINPGLVFCRIPHFVREFTIIMGNQMYGHDNGKIEYGTNSTTYLHR